MDEKDTQNQTPKEPTANKPERVVRTYQSDLKKVTSGMSPSELEKVQKEMPARPSTQEPQQQTPPTPPQVKEVVQETPQKPEVVKTPEQPEKTQESFIDTSNKLPEEQIKHYVEEIRSTVPEKKPIRPQAPVEPRPQLKEVKKPLVSVEEHSAPKKGFLDFIRSIFFNAPEEPVITEKAPAAPKQEEKIQQAPIIPQKPIQPVEKPAPVPEPVPVPPQPKPEVQKPEPVVQVPEPKPEVQKPFVPEAPKVPEPPKPIREASPLKTYSSDARENIQKKKETPLSVLAKQQDSKKGTPVRKAPQQKRSMMPMVIIGGILVFAGLGAIAAAYTFLAQDEPAPSTPRVVTPVFADSRTLVQANQTPTLRDLAQVTQTVPAPGSRTLTHITFERIGDIPQRIGINEIFIESPNVPGSFARAIYPQSMLGFYGDTSEPVFVLPVTSFERAFKGMLSWEDTIDQSLTPLWGALNRTPEETGTSTPPYVPVFVDEAFAGHDIRVLYDATGETYIVYGFVRENLLFITKTKETFSDLVGRIVNE